MEYSKYNDIIQLSNNIFIVLASLPTNKSKFIISKIKIKKNRKEIWVSFAGILFMVFGLYFFLYSRLNNFNNYCLVCYFGQFGSTRDYRKLHHGMVIVLVNFDLRIYKSNITKQI